MTVLLAPASRASMDWLHNTASAYFHELAPKEGALPRDEIIDWFDDPEAHPLLVTQSAQRVGFALVEHIGPHHQLCEIGILPGWRGKGIGAQSVTLCLDRFPGPWALGVAGALPGTARFWDRLLPALPGVTKLARGPALTPYQSHSYSFTYKGAP